MAESKPSAGAMRAAEALDKELGFDWRKNQLGVKAALEKAAQIIDLETGIAKLLKACGRVRTMVESGDISKLG